MSIRALGWTTRRELFRRRPFSPLSSRHKRATILGSIARGFGPSLSKPGRHPEPKEYSNELHRPTFVRFGLRPRLLLAVILLASSTLAVEGKHYFIDQSTDLGNGCAESDLTAITSGIATWLNSHGWSGSRYLNINARPRDFWEACDAHRYGRGLDSTYSDNSLFSMYAARGTRVIYSTARQNDTHDTASRVTSLVLQPGTRKLRSGSRNRNAGPRGLRQWPKVILYGGGDTRADSALVPYWCDEVFRAG